MTSARCSQVRLRPPHVGVGHREILVASTASQELQSLGGLVLSRLGVFQRRPGRHLIGLGLDVLFVEALDPLPIRLRQRCLGVRALFGRGRDSDFGGEGPVHGLLVLGLADSQARLGGGQLRYQVVEVARNSDGIALAEPCRHEDA
jgi:hypothetical protein